MYVIHIYNYIRPTAVRETSVSRCQGDPIESHLKAAGTLHHYRIEGFKVGPQWPHDAERRQQSGGAIKKSWQQKPLQRREIFSIFHSNIKPYFYLFFPSNILQLTAPFQYYLYR